LNQKYLAFKELLEHGANPNLEITVRHYDISQRYMGTTITTSLGALIENYIKPYKYSGFIDRRTDKDTLLQIIYLMRQYNANPLARFTSTQESHHSYEDTHSVKKTILDVLDYNCYNFPAGGSFRKELKDALKKPADLSKYIHATTSEGIQFAVAFALSAQKSGAQPMACVDLADHYFNNTHQNEEGLQTLLQKLQINDQGYAHIHLLFAQGYLASIDATDNKVADIEVERDQYRLLFLKHCLMGLASQEKDSEHKTATIKSISTLLQALKDEWALKGWEYSETVITNIFDFMAQALLRDTYSARDKVLSSSPCIDAIQTQSPAVLVAFSQQNTGQEGTMGKGKEKERVQGEAENPTPLRKSVG
jgi:hypothetical protein